MTAPIRYARSGDVNIAYQVTGDGPFDLVSSRASSRTWRSPASTRATRAFSGGRESFARLICFDKRGTGLRTGTSGSRTSRRAWTTSAP